MKHYAPNICLPLKINWKQDAKVRKRGIIQSHIYRNLPKFNQVNYTVVTICMPNIMILAQMVLKIFCWQGSIGLLDNSAKFPNVNVHLHVHLHLGNNVCDK